MNSLDVNYYNEKSYQTTLKSAVINKDDEKIDVIIKHHSFDQIKSQLTKAITLSIIQKDIKNFKKLIELKDNDINLILPSENISLLNFAISKKSAEITLEILDSPNFKTNQNAIQNTFEQIIKLF